MKIFKVLFVTFILILIFPEKNYSAEKEKTFDGKGGRDDFSYLKAKNSDFKKGKDAFKQAKKLKKKNKVKKSTKRFNDSLNYFLLAYNKNPDSLEILGFLGLVYKEVGDPIMSEIYYQDALLIDPRNPLINKGLGELYFDTKRMNLAKERLEVLKSCGCEEYSNLKKVIEKIN